MQCTCNIKDSVQSQSYQQLILHSADSIDQAHTNCSAMHLQHHRTHCSRSHTSSSSFIARTALTRHTQIAVQCTCNITGLTAVAVIPAAQPSQCGQHYHSRLQAYQQLILHGVDSIDQSQAVAVGWPGLHHEEGCLDWRHNTVHQDPVKLQHRTLLPSQVVL